MCELFVSTSHTIGANWGTAGTQQGHNESEENKELFA